MASVHPVTISCSDSLFERIERARGAEPRATWIKRAIEQAMPGPAPLSMDTGEPIRKVPVARDPPAERVGVPPRAISKVPPAAQGFRAPVPSELAKELKPARSLVDGPGTDLPRIAKR